MVELELEEDREGVAVIARMRDGSDRTGELEPFLCEELFVSSLRLCRGLLGPGSGHAGSNSPIRHRVMPTSMPMPSNARSNSAASAIAYLSTAPGWPA
jgi:hypothetical protein